MKQIVQLIVGTATGDGNCLLNVGPRPDGTIQPSEVERLHELGEWMRKYGHTIYGSRGGPYKNGQWGGSTHKGDKIWIHVTNLADETLRLSPLPWPVKSAKVLTGGEVTFVSDKEALALTFPLKSRDAIDTIIELTVDGSIPDTQVVGGSLDTVTMAAKYGKMLAAKEGKKTAESVEMDLGKVCKVNAISLQGGKKTVTISLSADGKEWSKVWTSPDAGGKWLAEITHLQAGVNIAGAEARYVKIEGAPAFERLEIYGE